METPSYQLYVNFTQCTGQKYDTPPYSFIMAERGRKRFSAEEVLEVIFADEDSSNENFDCGSDVECVPNSEADSACEESDLDDSIAISPSAANQEPQILQKHVEGNHLCV